MAIQRGVACGDAHDSERPAETTALQIQAGEREQKIAKITRRAAGRRVLGGGRLGGDQGAGGGELGGDVARGEQAMMADLDEAFGQDVQDESAEKLFRGEGDLGRAPRPEGDAAVIQCDEAPIGQADAVGILPEIAEGLVAIAEGRFAIGHPALVSEFVAETLEALAIGDRRA